jgi:hypothetical protein
MIKDAREVSESASVHFRNDAGNGTLLGLRSRLHRREAVSDADFDAVYPLGARHVSSTFWTPVAVAIRAAELLVESSSSRILDIGSGVGKFCIVGASATGATFAGIEQRAHLVQIAEWAAKRLAVDTAHFANGTFEAIDVRSFDGIYLFNPFEENRWRFHDQLDWTVELSERRFEEDVERAERLLDRARMGTRVVTYHGFGGEMPASYRHVHREPHRSGHLDLWVKEAARNPFRRVYVPGSGAQEDGAA